MKNKLFLLSLLFLVCILSISAISAADNTTNKDVISDDNDNLETSIHDDVSTGKENCELDLEQNNNDELKFTDLNTTINGNSDSTIYLSNNYKYNDDSDSDFKDGIYIDRNLTVYGNGVTIDGNLTARIFKVSTDVTVGFHDITFINGKAHDGGAIFYGNAYNCTFTENKADNDGGAIYSGDAYDCTFTGNQATKNGGAIANGDAYNCIFESNSASDGGAIYYGDAHDCTFTGNKADKDGGAIYRGAAYNSTFAKNNANNHGGAIYRNDANGCIFINNTAGEGGAIYYGNAHDCKFTGNKAERGGAIRGSDEMNVNATNCIFAKNEADKYGGAIDNGNAYNCNFDANYAKEDGGAINKGYARFCTFTNNLADNDGGAIDDGIAVNCTFMGNTAKNGDAMHGGTGALCKFNADSTDGTEIPTFFISVEYISNCKIGERLKFNLKAQIIDMIIDGFNSTLEIYDEVNQQFYTIAHALSGEGWIVDIDPGEYRVIINIPEFQEVSGEETILTAGSTTFTDLNTAINGNNNSVIYLSNKSYYKYNDTLDYGLKEGIYINRNLTIYGNGAKMNGNSMARIFRVDDGVTVEFHNMTFINGNADTGGALYYGNAYNCKFRNNAAVNYGGALYSGKAYNCTFDGNTAGYGGAIADVEAYNCTLTGNKAWTQGGAMNGGNTYDCTFISNNSNDGGAMHHGTAYNSTFINNTSNYDGGAIEYGNAYNCTFLTNYANENGGGMYFGRATFCTFRGNRAIDGQAMYKGTAYLCKFNRDSTYGTEIPPAIINVLNYNSTYNSGEKLKFNLTLKDDVFDGLETSIRINIKGRIVQTAYGLTGEGWIVDLAPGEYTAVLSLIDYSDGEPSIATINVSKGNTNIDISPISTTKVGKEVTINYTTNSNGTVTIKVNGKKINGNKFTPTKEGIYNVTVEVAENYYYTAATKQVTFNVTDYLVKLLENKDLGPLYSAKAVYKVLVIYDGQTVCAGETVIIKFNGKTYPVLTNSKGYAILNLKTKVKPKTYIITAEYHGVKVSNKVTVKNIIDAKDKKVKKSKKVNKVKVSLKKVNGKYLKGEVLKIKFNKKTYKVKTNKKGKATWKVKKSMLKNLKIGKKYKYKVTYGKDVATKKLMIKK